MGDNIWHNTGEIIVNEGNIIDNKAHIEAIKAIIEIHFGGESTVSPPTTKIPKPPLKEETQSQILLLQKQIQPPQNQLQLFKPPQMNQLQLFKPPQMNQQQLSKQPRFKLQQFKPLPFKPPQDQVIVQLMVLSLIIMEIASKLGTIS